MQTAANHPASHPPAPAPAKPAPLTAPEQQRFNELMGKSQSEHGLSEAEFEELKALHDKAAAYAGAWSADPAAAAAANFSVLQHLVSAMHAIADLSPMGGALGPALKAIDAALLTSEHATTKPEPVPAMPPAPKPPEAKAPETKADAPKAA